MKIGIHLSTFCTEWNEDLSEHIKSAKEIGYDAVEFPLLNPFLFDVNKYKSILEEQNMIGLCSTGLSLETDITSENAITRENGINHLKKCIDICKELGSPHLAGVIYSPWGVLKSKKDGEKNIAQLILSMRRVADYARQYGINLNLEVINRYETYVINTLEEGVNLLKLIDRENLGLHFDTFHAHIEERNTYEAIICAGNSIKHVHFCDNNRGIPLSGQVNWPLVSKGLKNIGYDGYICLECFVNTNCEIGNGTSIWRQIDTDGFSAAKQGYTNIRKVMEL